MKRIPMLLQLVLILFCVMSIPTAILTWYSGTQILHHSENAIAESTLAELDANRKLNEQALDNLVQDTVRLNLTNIFDRIRSLQTYEELNQNYYYVTSAQSVLKELLNLIHGVDGVYSSYFLLEGADYVVSTDKGIIALDRYEPTGWMQEALLGRKGIKGVWYPRKLSSGVNVVSYVLPLSRLSTTTRGAIVVNLLESQIEGYLSSPDTGKHGYLLMDSDSTIISHDDKSLLLTQGSNQPFIEEILESGTNEGYAFHELEGEHLLYTWSRSVFYGWWNVSLYPVDDLMIQTHTLQRSIMFITAIIIVAGTILTIFLATWLSKPVRDLVRTIHSRYNWGIYDKRNEMAFLDTAFKRMQEEEESLYELLQEREQDTRSLAVRNLLQGEVSKQVTEMFPEPYYVVAVISIDQYMRYVNKNSQETRNYHRYLLITECEGLFMDKVHASCVYQGEGCFVVVINYGQEELEGRLGGIHEALHVIRDRAAQLLEHTVTIGVSSQTENSSEVSARIVEANEVIKFRMIEGSGRITFWEEEPERSKKYIYPANSERRIINYLETGSLDSIAEELAVIRKEILGVEYISYDNIMFIYNQLVGVTIKHLRENNINTARIFAGRGNIYSAIASMDTLDELEDYLREFFEEIIQYLARGKSEVNYGERIIRYLERKFSEEIVFEEMAKEIGISYSYMRKIVYELTGKSMIDYINLLRIEKAKKLLLESNSTIAQIAAEIGYFNVRSLNRFFLKYEGMSPSAYKISRHE
ncbi:helix-turn-helix domain-containing protein [Paenibacillus sp. LMG 31459]|uniref:Helix-turn-helix domain-containing protein n=1 Tax=Paenibacillus phytohabitans TaxID=2654978 RepID=A0ABX1YDH9_9BACL|nr:AraC family transcriptional regulator [Paenibacillus phytohabitans]NOU79035.1 helix-turn-helix domain-containing protein [Paenibacillus phytohabitans]